MPDTVTLVLDAEQYHRELARLTAGTQRLGRGTEESFLRGDRAVRRATQNIVQGLTTANSAADAVLITFQSLERVFKIPIGATIGAAAAIAGVAALRQEFQKTQEVYDKAKKALGVPLKIEAKLSPENIASRIEEVSKAVEDLRARMQSPGEAIARFFAAAASGGLGSAAARQAQQQQLLNDLLAKQAGLSAANADQLLRIASLKSKEARDGKEVATSAKALIDFETKRAELLKEVKTHHGQTLDFQKKELANYIEQAAVIRASVEALKAKKAAAQESQTDFFADVGSGRIGQQFQAFRQRQIDAARGEALVNEIREGQARGFFKDPFSQFILRQADKAKAEIAAVDKMIELAKLDFSNLQSLSKYDFSGLGNLSGLTITIE